MNKKEILSAVEKCVQSSKGKRKFKQSIDLAVNFKDVDFKKPENRISLNVTLPHTPKKVKVGVIASGDLAFKAKKVADLVLEEENLEEYAKDEKKKKEMLNYRWLAEPKFMPTIGKLFGQLLAPRGKMPTPLPPKANLEAFISRVSKSVILKTKGNYLPVLHCIVGNEEMSIEEIAENVLAVLDALKTKVSEKQIKSIYVKATMGPSFKVIIK